MRLYRLFFRNLFPVLSLLVITSATSIGMEAEQGHDQEQQPVYVTEERLDQVVRHVVKNTNSSLTMLDGKITHLVNGDIASLKQQQEELAKSLRELKDTFTTALADHERRLGHLEVNEQILMGKAPHYIHLLRVDMPLKIAGALSVVYLLKSGDMLTSMGVFTYVYTILKIVFEKAVVIRNALPK